jgi:hypothetical protein
LTFLSSNHFFDTKRNHEHDWITPTIWNLTVALSTFPNSFAKNAIVHPVPGFKFLRSTDPSARRRAGFWGRNWTYKQATEPEHVDENFRISS